MWQIVLLWVLQRSCSFSVIVEEVCSKTALAVFILFFGYLCYQCYLFELLLNDYQSDLQCFIWLKNFCDMNNKF